uniref:Uncharacterized protein n=1 Tax=Chenopodium quinoa TaxID=63459 RepID=A0A803MK96_CHEQI
MQIALGRSASDEIKSGLHKISKRPVFSLQTCQRKRAMLRGQADFLSLFSGDKRLSEDGILASMFALIFEEFEVFDFARTGCLATEKLFSGFMTWMAMERGKLIDAYRFLHVEKKTECGFSWSRNPVGKGKSIDAYRFLHVEKKTECGFSWSRNPVGKFVSCQLFLGVLIDDADGEVERSSSRKCRYFVFV